MRVKHVERRGREAARAAVLQRPFYARSDDFGAFLLVRVKIRLLLCCVFSCRRRCVQRKMAEMSPQLDVARLDPAPFGYVAMAALLHAPWKFDGILPWKFT